MRQAAAQSESFSYLRKLPVHEIKIDKSFIDDLALNHDEVIVRSTIDLAHALCAL